MEAIGEMDEEEAVEMCEEEGVDWEDLDGVEEIRAALEDHFTQQAGRFSPLFQRFSIEIA